MRGWRCGSCGQVVFLDSSQCLHCGSFVGFVPSSIRVEALHGNERICDTASTSGCTWVVEDDRDRCIACRQVTLVPPLDDPTTAQRYREAMDDLRHLVVQLLELSLPVDAVEVQFPSSRYDDTVVIGHGGGVVTIDVEEADDVRRERMRDRLDEAYRTVLGHLRHEYGHALFAVIVGGDDLEQVRAVFGDEREDYQAALDRHYSQGPPADWQHAHVSPYATMHPAEDWAETFAHVLHVTDVVRAADAFGLRLDPDRLATRGMHPEIEPDPERRATGIGAQLAVFVPLTIALNAVSRALGEGQLYPFVLTGPVVEKIELVGDLIGLR